MGRKILGSGGVRIRLPFLGRVMSIVVHFRGMSAERFVGSGMVFHDARLLVVRKGIVRGFFAVSLVRMLFFLFLRGSGVAQRFTGKQLDNIGRSG